MFNPRQVASWPAVRCRKNQSTVKGWYAVQWRVALLQKIMPGVVGAVGLALIVASGLPVLFTLADQLDIPEGTAFWSVINTLVFWRRDAGIFVVDQAPELARTIGIDPMARYSWKLAAAGLALLMLRKPIGICVRWTLALGFPLLIKARFSVRITPELVTIRRLCWVSRFRVDQPTPIQFFAEGDGPDRGLGSGVVEGRVQRMRVSMRYGFRGVRIARGMHPNDAKRLSAALNYAHNAVRSSGDPGGQGWSHGAPIVM